MVYLMDTIVPVEAVAVTEKVRVEPLLICCGEGFEKVMTGVVSCPCRLTVIHAKTNIRHKIAISLIPPT